MLCPPLLSGNNTESQLTEITQPIYGPASEEPAQRPSRRTHAVDPVLTGFFTNSEERYRRCRERVSKGAQRFYGALKQLEQSACEAES
jgi:hypothetical protein